VITDQYCLQHAGFFNYPNVKERVFQKENQPENAERLMVLIDKAKGVLTKAQTLTNQPNYFLKETSTEAKLADILRIHDFRYIKNVQAKCNQS